MSYRRRIVGSEVGFSGSGRLSPGVGAIRLFPQQNPWVRAFGWTRWWHWAGLALALLLMIDARL
jgi:hypothetical protein